MNTLQTNRPVLGDTIDKDVDVPSVQNNLTERRTCCAVSSSKSSYNLDYHKYGRGNLQVVKRL